MVQFFDDKHEVNMLCSALKTLGVDYSPDAGEINVKSYEERVRQFLIHNEFHEQGADSLINNAYAIVKNSSPLPDELEWFICDPRASYWFLVKTELLVSVPETPGNIFTENVYVYNFKVSGKLLPPEHNARVNYLKEIVRQLTPTLSMREYIIKSHREWSDMIAGQNIFNDVNSSTGVTLKWLINYLRENKVALREYPVGESMEEKLAFCYASYFTWFSWYENSDADKKLFLTKFKSALSTQKSRVKKRTGNLKVLNVNVSEETHDKIRDVSISEGISNSRVIEYAINLAWKEKRFKN